MRNCRVRWKDAGDRVCHVIADILTGHSLSDMGLLADGFTGITNLSSTTMVDGIIIIISIVQWLYE